jgi:hypothetical protein
VPETRPTAQDEAKVPPDVALLYAALSGHAEALRIARRIVGVRDVAVFQFNRLDEANLRVGIPAARALADLDEALVDIHAELVDIWTVMPPRATAQADRLRAAADRIAVERERALRTSGER